MTGVALDLLDLVDVGELGLVLEVVFGDDFRVVDLGVRDHANEHPPSI